MFFINVYVLTCFTMCVHAHLFDHVLYQSVGCNEIIRILAPQQT